MSGTDLLIQRARKFKQTRRELMEVVDKMKEPSPANRNEALALAVNSVYRRNLVRTRILHFYSTKKICNHFSAGIVS